MSIKERFIIDEKGKKTAVVLTIAEYQQLKKDLHDLRTIAERLEEPAISP